MLPDQHDILWTFLSILFTVFSLTVFVIIVQYCRERDDVDGKKWGGIFGVFLIANFLCTKHMFTLVQGDQLIFIWWQVLVVFVQLLVWGIFCKSDKIESQSPPLIRAVFFWVVIGLLLAGYTNWLPQQRSDPPPKGGAAISADLTMEEFADMGRVIVFGAKQVAGQKSIGKGQCPLCHTFEPGNNIGRCPNLFGVEERSHTRIKEERYLNLPVKIGEKEPATGVVKGKRDGVDPAYQRGGSDDLNGEDYLRESLMCPSCYVVTGFGKEGDTKSPMPVISKPPISLNPVELNAVIAWLQSKDTPGEFSKVTVPLPSAEDSAPKAADSGEEEERPVFVTGEEDIPTMINTLGCPLCHTIPGVEGAVGELGPKLHEKTNAPLRIKDSRYEGKATNTKEYVRESILCPGCYIVMNEAEGELFPDGVMPPDFANKLSVKAIDKLVDFIANTEAPPAG